MGLKLSGVELKLDGGLMLNIGEVRHRGGGLRHRGGVSPGEVGVAHGGERQCMGGVRQEPDGEAVWKEGGELDALCSPTGSERLMHTRSIEGPRSTISSGPSVVASSSLSSATEVSKWSWVGVQHLSLSDDAKVSLESGGSDWLKRLGEDSIWL